MLEKTEGEIKNGQSRDTCNIGIRHKTNKQQYRPWGIPGARKR